MVERLIRRDKIEKSQEKNNNKQVTNYVKNGKKWLRCKSWRLLIMRSHHQQKIFEKKVHNDF